MELMGNDHPATVLLAGFAAFPGAPVNPAERLIRRFDSSSLRSGARVECLVVPVEWERSWEVLRGAIREVRPDAVLQVGLHAGADRFRIETTAFNERAMDRPDAAGRLPETVAIRAGPPSLRARLPTEALERELRRAGLDVGLSADAGRYLCNETLYHLCLEGPTLGLRYFGFVHTPLTDGCASARGQAVVATADLALLAARALDCLAEEVRRGEDRRLADV
jgi:pyroglutamyl-peptidase